MTPLQLDKENTVVPSTPSHQLKAPSLESFNQTRNNKNASISPSKRLPFASKDNNTSVSKSLFSNIVKQPLVPSNDKQPLRHNHLNDNNINNKKRLKKYGSILGHTEPLSLRKVPSIQLPRTKSLVLKDPIENRGESNSESESESDEDWNNPFQLKLQNALNKAQSQSSPTKQSTVDREIEYKSEPVEELPYIPDGYTPFTQEDLTKLNEYHPHDVLVDGTVVKDDIGVETVKIKSTSPTLLPLELDFNIEEHELDGLSNTQVPHTSNQTNKMTHNNTDSSVELLPLDMDYNGEGLTDADVIDLIDSI